MREMKDSGIAWVGDVPEGWEVVRLQFAITEICDSNNTLRTTSVLSLTNKLGVVPYEEKGNQGNKAKENYSEYKIAYPNTIVANSMNILIGSVGISKYYGCVSPVYYVFKEKDDTSIEYVNYIMQIPSFQKELRKFANGILEIRLRVSSDDILKRRVPLPPLAEQRLIADYLNGVTAKVNTIIAKKREQISTLEEYKKSLIYEYVTGKKEVPSEGAR